MSKKINNLEIIFDLLQIVSVAARAVVWWNNLPHTLVTTLAVRAVAAVIGAALPPGI
jgi:hypothetical protein